MSGRVSITLSVKRYNDPYDLIYNKLDVPRDLGFYWGRNSKGYALFLIPSSNQNTLDNPDQLADTIREKKHPLIEKVEVKYKKD